jgi:ATP-dependent Clp protease ATP-binding subunit ClpB
VIRDIVRIQVADVVKRLEDKGITLTFTDAALDLLAKEGYSTQYGARPLKRLVQAKVLTHVANLMVNRAVLEGGSVKVDAKGSEFTFDVKRGPDRQRNARARAKVEA